MANQLIHKSYKIHFNSIIKTRQLTESKKNIILNISNYFKSATNFIYKTNHEGYNSWKNMSKGDFKFVRNHYEKEFGEIVTSGYAQNLYKFVNDKYSATKKAYYSDFTQNKIKNKNAKLLKKGIIPKKSYFKKPYSEDFLAFPLDNRMLKGSGKDAFRKDEKIKDLYWLSILNPFKKSDYKKNINIPLKLYPEILKMLDKGYKYSFLLHNDYIEIVFSYKIEDEKLNKEIHKLDKIAIDFGKYISTYDGSKSEQYDLSKMYNKINKILKQASNFQSELAIMKENNDFSYAYGEIKNEIDNLYKKIFAIRKSSYGQIKNILSNQYKTIIIEDLNFNQIEKKTLKNNKNKSYKGKNFNKILRIMGRGVWIDIMEKVTLVGNQLVKKNPAYSSQKCSSCQEINKSSRKGRQFNCLSCGHFGDADINASMNLYA